MMWFVQLIKLQMRLFRSKNLQCECDGKEIGQEFESKYHSSDHCYYLKLTELLPKNKSTSSGPLKI